MALMTTRRRGSSPSDTVATPSISFTVSWTTLRSTRRHRLEDLVAARLDGPLGGLPGELGQRLLAPGPVAGHVDVDPGAVPPIRRWTAVRTSSWTASSVAAFGARSAGRGRRRRCRPVTSSSPSVRAATVGRQPEALDETPGEGLRQLGLFLERHV